MIFTSRVEYVYKLTSTPFIQIICKAVKEPGPATSRGAGTSSLSKAQTCSTLTLLIGCYHVGYYSTIGRATRGYIALHVEGQCLVFLKDSWRADSPDIHPELEVYAKLVEHSVRYVATALGGGDVGIVVDGVLQQQRTLSQDYNQSISNLLSRLHYRLVTKEIGLPMSEYTNSYFLALILAQACTGECS